MLTNSKKECPFTDEIVSYIYGEIDGVERGSFETHIADCVTCTDDFAAISNARFSVFEWRKEEFDQLATPSFVIPELAKPALVSESGWFAGLAALLSFARSPMAVSAALLVCLGVGLITLAYFRSSESLIATDTDVKVPAMEETEEKPVADPPDLIAPPDGVIKPTTVSGPKKQTPSYKPVRTAEVKPAVNNAPRRLSSPQIAKKPVLNDFIEETDTSLRLSDLLDEVGG